MELGIFKFFKLKEGDAEYYYNMFKGSGNYLTNETQMNFDHKGGLGVHESVNWHLVITVWVVFFILGMLWQFWKLREIKHSEELSKATGEPRVETTPEKIDRILKKIIWKVVGVIVAMVVIDKVGKFLKDKE